MCHGFGVAVYGEQQTDCYMPEAILDLFYDKIKWHQAHEWVDATVAEVQRVRILRPTSRLRIEVGRVLSIVLDLRMK
jgi:hypothetical protein